MPLSKWEETEYIILFLRMRVCVSGDRSDVTSCRVALYIYSLNKGLDNDICGIGYICLGGHAYVFQGL